MGFIHCFGQTNDEAILAGRHNIYLEVATKFFRMLTEYGAKLVFFCDGQLQQSRIDVWCDRKDREYNDVLATLSNIDAGRYRCSDKYCHRGSKYFVNSLLEIAKLYGTVIVASERDCDSITAQYATTHGALAIVASDSDYLIYEGNWQHWHVNSMDMVRCTVKRFNRDALMENLDLTRDQMKVFATVAGNDYTSGMRINIFGNESQFQKYAEFCRTLTPTEDDYREIAEYILDGREARPDSIEIIKNSIESYGIDFELATDTDKLELYVRENVLMHAILNDGIFQYHVSYVDFSHTNNNNNNNNRENVLDKILDTMRRLAGVLLFDKRTERNYFQLLTKHSHETKYELTREMPEFPAGNSMNFRIPMNPEIFISFCISSGNADVERSHFWR